MSEEEVRILRAMTPADKLRALFMLCESVRQMKAAGLRMMHPDWTEEQVQRALRDAILYART